MSTTSESAGRQKVVACRILQFSRVTHTLEDFLGKLVKGLSRHDFLDLQGL